jgi:hypothetical protein
MFSQLNDRVSSLEEQIFQLKEIVAGLKQQNDRLEKENADLKTTMHGNVLIGYFSPRNEYFEIPFFVNKNANYEDFMVKMRYVAGNCSALGLHNFNNLQAPVRYHHSLTGLICIQTWQAASVDKRHKILKIFQECKIDLLYNGELIKL